MKIFIWTQSEKRIGDALLRGEKLYETTVLDWFSALDEDAARKHGKFERNSFIAQTAA